jgi:hypothetical protein
VTPRDWSAEFLKLYADQKAKAAKATADREATRVAGTGPTAALAEYAGVYDHPVWGDLTVTEENGTLRVHAGPAPTMAGTLEHWHYETFRTKLGDGRGEWTWLTFSRAGDGRIRTVCLEMENSDACAFVRREK